MGRQLHINCNKYTRPKGTRFFEDVQPPNGWEWHSKKWELDLEAGEWVNERLVVGVEYDVALHSDTQTKGREDSGSTGDSSGTGSNNGEPNNAN